MTVRRGGALHRLASGEKTLEHSLFDHRNRLAGHSFQIELIEADQRLALPGGLRRIVDHVHPIRQDARTDLGVELAGIEVHVAAGFGQRLARRAEIIAEQLREKLRGGRGLEQGRPGKRFAHGSMGQRANVFGDRRERLAAFPLPREVSRFERLEGHGIAHHHSVRRLAFGARVQPGQAVVVAERGAFTGEQISDSVQILEIDAGCDHFGNRRKYGRKFDGAGGPGRFVDLPASDFRAGSSTGSTREKSGSFSVCAAEAFNAARLRDMDSIAVL